jgi:hypothetical protein
MCNVYLVRMMQVYSMPGRNSPAEVPTGSVVVVSLMDVYTVET